MRSAPREGRWVDDRREPGQVPGFRAGDVDLGDLRNVVRMDSGKVAEQRTDGLRCGLENDEHLGRGLPTTFPDKHGLLS